jgi:chromosome segregation ATPase
VSDSDDKPVTSVALKNKTVRSWSGRRKSKLKNKCVRRLADIHDLWADFSDVNKDIKTLELDLKELLDKETACKRKIETVEQKKGDVSGEECSRVVNLRDQLKTLQRDIKKLNENLQKANARKERLQSYLNKQSSTNTLNDPASA